MMFWTEKQIDTWCRSFHAYREHDTASIAARGIQQQRCRVRQELMHHLRALLAGRNTLQEFSAAFQSQAHPDWTLFGIHGLSGSTFLKKLVQQIPEKSQLASHLRSALLVPTQVSDAHQKMHTFHQFLETFIVEGVMSRAQLQPDRVPFFLSTWWHIQQEEDWPRFSGHLREYLLKELPLLDPVSNQVDLYFAFRERFLALKTAFGISAWELECFFHWHQQEQRKKQTTVSTHQKEVSSSFLDETSRRLHLQWLLATIGKKVGCQVWIARQDQEKSWKEEWLGQLSTSDLPALQNASSITPLEDAAVLWLLKEEVVAVFEIALNEEDIATNLLRLYDFSLILTRRRTRFCLALSKRHFEQVQRAFSRPVFRQQQERHPCALVSEEHLIDQGEHILRWATNPMVMEDIIAFSMV